MRLILRVLIRWMSVAGVFVGAVPAGAATITREALTSLLQHQESIVRSVECQFTSSRSVTPQMAIPLIRAVCRDQGREEEYARYVYTSDTVNAQSYAAHWWRQGQKERTERFAIAPDSPLEHSDRFRKISVFDGETIREAAYSEEGVLGSIQSSDRWYSVNRTHPVSLLYEFQNKPYSDLLARSQHCDVSVVDRNGESYTRVFFYHPDFHSLDSSSFVLLFDKNDLLVERDVILKFPRNRQPRVYETHTFSDYQEHSDRSGEQIRFPNRAVYHYYVGDLPDGTHVEYTSETIEIADIKFNVPIPERKFVLEFPKGARVYDELHKIGWLDRAAGRAKSAAEVTRPMTNRRWVMITCNLLLVVLIAIIVWRRRHRTELA